ncbi:MAG: hypothetical protein WDW38_010186 [Sanguina aurantia]
MLIQRVRAAGGEVKILLLTAGDNNPWPQRWLERRLRIDGDDRRRWGKRRQGELTTALQRLDVPVQSLQALGWPDLGITDILLTRSAGAVTALAAAIDAFQPGIMAIPSPADRHPDHGSAYVLIRLALAELGRDPRVLTYLIHGQDASGGSVEVTGNAAQASTKLHALDAHASQTALSGRRMRRLAGRPEHFLEQPRATRLKDMIAPAAELPWQPPIWLKSRLRLSIADRSGVQSWRWSDAPVHRESDGPTASASRKRWYVPPDRSFQLADMSPKYASALLGVTNTAGSVPGIVGVTTVGMIFQATHSWEQALFAPCTAFLALGMLAYSFGSRHEPIDFDAADNSPFAFEVALQDARAAVAGSLGQAGSRVRDAGAGWLSRLGGGQERQ